MKKPEHQWETRRHRAFRRPEPPGGAWAHDPRAEAFELRFSDGRSFAATCGLALQRVDAAAIAADPDLEHALACWLVARGARSMDLRDADGAAIAQRTIGPEALGDPIAASPRRIVTLAPSNLEMVAALGALDRVIACEDSSDFPPEAAGLPRLGPDLGPDLDRIAALTPDLVVSSLSVPGMERVVTGLRARGRRQVVLAPRSVADVLAEIERTGAHLGLPAAAAGLVERMRAEIAELEAERIDPPVDVYLEWWPRPMFTPGSACWSNELIRLAGGRNVFCDRAGASVEIDAAELVAADPEVCFVSWCGVSADKLEPQRVGERSGLAALRAVRGGRVYPLDEALAGRPGPRMLEAARVMARAIRSAREAVS